MENMVIIGSGPAGLTAAIYSARAGLKPVVLEGIQPGGQLVITNLIENYPGFLDGIDGPTLMMTLRSQAERFGARLKSGEVTAVDFRRKPFQVVVDGGEALEAKTIIIATGASAIYLGLESEQALIGRGVSACATCDAALYRDKAVAVVGGGDTAMEEALFLARFASRVTIIHRRDQFRASKIMIERVLKNPKIQVLWNSVVIEVLDVVRREVVGLRLKHIQTGAISDLPVEGLFVAIGHRPNTEPFAGQVATDKTGYILTDHTRTNIPGVFAAGDVQDPEYRQAITAAGSGCMAALEAERYLNA
ncbi:MAG: thioredoxin-disulfide reductase [Verrucomicrobia bacterium]|nr:thioredoxin-disulfide reductase [Verrucomicrobiota bacterium]MBU4292044.1 thioredoxin-disulfide reductase [Verrucomicrobiota bacterium]MBU4427932.1 thioredoxin-disulfide reductase [Verrucomicrobiota bacterium]MCG2678878.1 thioredoxin-disulfide reductase [Kiritimatiellia bacterium]